MGVVCGIKIYEGIRRRKPLFKILAHLVPCEHLSMHSQRQGGYETTNASHHLHFSLGRLRSLLLVVTLPSCSRHLAINSIMALRGKKKRVRTVKDVVHFLDNDFHTVTNVPNIIAHAVCGLQTLQNRHPTFLLRQFVEPSQGIFDIRSSYQLFQESF